LGEGNNFTRRNIEQHATIRNRRPKRKIEQVVKIRERPWKNFRRFLPNKMNIPVERKDVVSQNVGDDLHQGLFSPAYGVFVLLFLNVSLKLFSAALKASPIP